jgi:glycerophosphoryl diester phosphodiesterase
MASESKERLLAAMPSSLKPPPPLFQPGVEKLDSPVTISDDTVFPNPLFTNYRHDARKRRMPQCIAHRGYKAKYPENTMAAFKTAVETGVQALETDVHITKDEVVVISHDAAMKRCFGINKKIKDMYWDELKDVETIREPHQTMPKLKDVFEYLAQPGLEEVWLLLDIKLDNDADQIMRLIGSTIATVPAPEKKAWHERVLLGIWAAKFLPLADKYLPGFPVTHIGFSVPYARHFFTVPNVSFNMLLPMLIAPGGRKFMRDAREKYHRQLYAWTVNNRDKMEWCIRRKLDGVITDDPKLFLQVCDEFDEDKKEPWPPIRVRGYIDMARIYFFVTLMAFLFRKMLRPVASPSLIRKVEVPQQKLKN